MESSDVAKEVLAAVSEQVEQLTLVAATSGNACLSAQVIALHDVRALEVFYRKISNQNYVFKCIECIEGTGIPEQKRVLFKFDCKPGVFCLVNPSFLVVVELPSRRVVSIIDPYIHTDPLARRSCDCAGATTTAAASRTFTESREFLLAENVKYLKIRVDIKPCKHCHFDLYAKLSHPSIGDIEDAVRDCIHVAAVAAAIAAIISAVAGAAGAIPGAASAAFSAALKACLISKGIGFANDIDIELVKKNEDCGDWSRNCDL